MTRPRQRLLLHRRLLPGLLPIQPPIQPRQRPIPELSHRNPRALSPLLAPRRQRLPPAIPTSLSNSLRQPIQAQLGSNLRLRQQTSGKIDSEACRPVVAKMPRPAGIFS